MKKFLAIILTIAFAFTMVLAFTSCGEKELTVAELYAEAYKKNSELDSFDATAKMTIAVSSEGVSMDIPVEYSMKASGLKSGKMQTSGTMKMTAMGISLDIPFYSDGEYVYMSMFGQKMKQSAKDSEVNTDEITGIIKNLDEPTLKDATATDNEDGSKTIEIVYDEENFKKVFSDLIDSVMDSAGADAATAEGVKINISNMKQKVTINADKYISATSVSFDIEVEITKDGETQNAKLSMTMDITYNNIGTEVKVDVPTDLDQYEESSSLFE